MSIATIIIEYHSEFPDWVMAALLLMVLIPVGLALWMTRK